MGKRTMGFRWPISQIEKRIRAFCINNCRRRGVVFNLSQEQFNALAYRPCHYCGAPPKNKYNMATLVFFYQGIDRLDNDKGYVPGNCVPCCSRCNSIKGEHLSHEEMILVASLLLGLRRSRLPGTPGPRARAGSTRSPRKARTR